uniref:Uncharacterized protein n=1 Tax=Eutreptiella gymnastica TaxID=73025 RepID=A0A7S1NMM7_9EUGL|mmetsp:Transcript_62442/g.111247  ORF Transcript_62442/g.111247 Transcript_62442/m.111247 type:complete len:312 (+) Transcript_62442:75-1010(+)
MPSKHAQELAKRAGQAAGPGFHMGFGPKGEIIEPNFIVGGETKVNRVQKLTKESCLKVFDQVEELLDPDLAVWWHYFLEADCTLESKLEPSEFMDVLKKLMPMASDADLRRYMGPDLERKELISFLDVITWWTNRQNEEQRSSSSGSSKQSDTDTQQLQEAVQNNRRTAKWKTIFSTNEKEAAITQMSEAAVQHSIRVYFDVFFSVKERKDEQDFGPKKQQELVDMEVAKTTYVDEYTEHSLQAAFAHFAGTVDGDVPQSELPPMASLMGYDVPHSAMTLTAQVYPDPLKYEDFKSWWIIRTGKIKHGWFF